MKILRYILYWMLQWTWGILQNTAGLLVFLFQKIRSPEGRTYLYHGAVVQEWADTSGLSLGMFLFVEKNAETCSRDILVHEYGHSLQSLFLGPLYLPLIGLPSVLWANVPALRRMRREKHISYYRFYPEAWANAWGSLAVHEPAPDMPVQYADRSE